MLIKPGGVFLNDIDFFDPFRQMNRMRRRMSGPGTPFLDFEFKETGLRSPLIDMRDAGKEIEVVAELPGIKKEDIEIDLNDKYLSIKGKSVGKVDTEKKNYYYKERSFEEFSRTVPLPAEVLPEKAEAEFKNGILKLSIPKRQSKEKPRGFKVKIN